MKSVNYLIPLFLLTCTVGCQTIPKQGENELAKNPNLPTTISAEIHFNAHSTEEKATPSAQSSKTAQAVTPTPSIENTHTVVRFQQDEDTDNFDSSMDEIIQDEKTESNAASLLPENSNDNLFDPELDKINPLLCNDGVYYDAWVAQFNQEWLHKYGKKYKRASDRKRAMTLARTNEFINLVYPAIEKTGYDYPLVINPLVLSWIAYFVTGPGRKNFVVWLERGQTLIPQMQKILDQNGLPSDLVYLSMIESGYSFKAMSSVGARGLWQFMPGTAREYGLKINDWLDERSDVQKSTQAAAEYLNNLYTQFGSWHLAAAGYNGGPGLVMKSLRRYGEDSSFFDISSKRKMNSQTANYVPKIIAAMIVAKNASLFGFDSQENSLFTQTKTIPVTRSIALSDLAKTIQVDSTVLEQLNPQLRLGITPPASATAEGFYNLTVPASKADLALASLSTLPDGPTNHLVAARIKRSEKVSAFAKRYKLTLASVLNSNNHLKANSNLRKGQVVYISVALGTGQYDRLTTVKYKKSKHHHPHKVAKNKKLKKANVKHSTHRVAYK